MNDPQCGNTRPPWEGGGEGIPRTQPAGQLTYKKKIINFVFPCGHIPRHTEFSRPSRTRGAPQGNPGWTPGRTLLDPCLPDTAPNDLKFKVIS